MNSEKRIKRSVPVQTSGFIIRSKTLDPSHGRVSYYYASILPISVQNSHISRLPRKRRAKWRSLFTQRLEHSSNLCVNHAVLSTLRAHQRHLPRRHGRLRHGDAGEAVKAGLAQQRDVRGKAIKSLIRPPCRTPRRGRRSGRAPCPSPAWRDRSCSGGSRPRPWAPRPWGCQ